jgi:hypothetical protein
VSATTTGIVSWTASSTTGATAPTSYLAERSTVASPDDSLRAWSPACITSATSCPDGGFPTAAGTYRFVYQVTARYNTAWKTVSTESSLVTVTVVPPAGITSASPSGRGQGAPATLVTITGTGFTSGAGLAASFGTGTTSSAVTRVSATTITAMVTVSAGATTGPRDVSVTQGGPGATLVCSGCFTISAAPTVTSLSPSSVAKGQTGVSVVVNGTGFVAGASVDLGGGGVTVTNVVVNSGTKITLTVNLDQSATKSGRSVTVLNADGGSGTLSAGFTVTT